MYGRKEQKLRRKHRLVFGCFPYKKKGKTYKMTSIKTENRAF